MKNKILKISSLGLFFITIPLIAQNKPIQEPISIVNLAYNPYQNYPIYTGADLGVNYTKEKTIIKVWAPPAEEFKVILYKTATGNDKIKEILAKKDKTGVWIATIKDDVKNQYYTVQVKINNKWLNEVTDPYAKAVGTNGKRGQIIDLRETNPQNWDKDYKPVLKLPTDVVLYEIHLRDLSSANNSGIKNKGKYLAFTELGTKNEQGQSTGIDHIGDMGITHLHILPAFDYQSVDESVTNAQFNWGYDPQNYNVPEGSYATNAEDGKIRIKEYKQMVQALHKKGIRVVMDVVYNHTGKTFDSNFDQIVPGYYYRQWEKDKKYSDAASCGNETASDRIMMRKFMIESVLYWAKEYHIDGFRFDLMAIHDIETMNEIAEALHAYDPSIIIYGEGWTAGDSPLPEKYRALKMNAPQLKGIAVFSDDIRDGIKGNVFEDKSIGFASGATNMTEAVRIGIVGAGAHPQIDYTKGYYAKKPFANNPTDVINYVSCHDNHTLYDKLKISKPKASENEILKMQRLANTIVLTSQGIPFLHAGVEMKRTKGGEHNSYNKPDIINQINWDWKNENLNLVTYFQQLIALRKAHPAFRMPTNALVQKHLKFIDNQSDPNLIAYQITGNANGDTWKNILVIFNGSEKEKQLNIPDGNWNIAIKDGYFNEGIYTDTHLTIQAYSTTILYQK